MGRHYDIVVIGSGAGGATFANAMARTGKSILILERGPQLPIEPDNWNSKAVFIDKKYVAKELWLDKNNKEFRPNTHYWLGGNTTFYGAALMRMKRRDFDAVPHCGGGVSPAWPISYDEMRGWYAQAEERWQVHGERGIDPFDEKDDPPYPYPALTHDPGIVRLKDHFESLGWRPAPLPLGVRRNDAAPVLDSCIRCSTCGGHPCLLRAKVDARTAEILPLWRAPNVTILTERKVVRLETSADGRRITEVVAETKDGPERYRADIVVCAAGAVNSAALFLASANAAHPNGLANGSDQVGRNYMFHMTSAVLSLSLEKFEATFPKTLCVNDFYFGEPDGSYPFPMGQIQLLEYMSGDTLQGEIANWLPSALIPDAFADAVADRLVSFLAMSEDLPSPDNRVTLTREGRIRLSYAWGDTSAHERLVKRLENALCGFARHTHSLLEHRYEVDSLLPLFGTAHQCGTLRFGADPKSSVLDPNCKAHELDNLYVVDSSFFPSSAAVNPTLTIVANALRVAAHLRERLS